MHVLLKFVSFVWMQRRQHSYVPSSARELLCRRRRQKKTTDLLVALLLPLGDQIRVRVAVLQQPVVELLADGFLLVVEVVDVPRTCDIKNAEVSALLCAPTTGSLKVVKKRTIALTFAGPDWAR